MPSHFYLHDVGHGLCALIQDETSGKFVIDCGGDPLRLQEALVRLSWLEINALLISHADEDHARGAVALLNDPRVPGGRAGQTISIKRVFVNADSRTGESRDMLYSALLKFEKEFKQSYVDHAILARRDINVGGALSIELLHPGGALTFRPASSRAALSTERVHTQSAVVKIAIRNNASESILIMGDLNDAGLERMLELSSLDELRCSVLVYPHHGGLGADPTRNRDFAKKLLQVTKPSYVLFPNGRKKHDNPRMDVVSTVREVLGDAVIIQCSQMNGNCNPETTYSCPESANHLLDAKHPLRASQNSYQCAGTIHFVLDEVLRPGVAPVLHTEFVQLHAPQARCRVAPKVP